MNDEELSQAYRKLFGQIKEKLTDRDLEKASDELHETQELKISGVKDLRQHMLEQEGSELGKKILSNIGEKSDDEILRFLRARKFNIQKAYGLMEGYVKFREKYTEISENLMSEDVRRSLEHGYPGLLPFRDRDGHVVLLFSIGTWDSKDFSFDTVLQGYILLLEQLLQNESAQINGFVIIENFNHYSMAQAFSMRPSDLKKMVDMLQGAFPARFKGVHFIYQPWYFTWTYAIVKPFLKKKLADRVHIHGWNLEKFHELFDRNQLPVEFGGLGPAYNPGKMTEELYRAIDSTMSKGSNSPLEEDSFLALADKLQKTQITD